MLSSVGSRQMVWEGSADRTSGGLIQKDLMLNRKGVLVSKKASESASKRWALYRLKKNMAMLPVADDEVSDDDGDELPVIELFEHLPVIELFEHTLVDNDDDGDELPVIELFEHLPVIELFEHTLVDNDDDGDEDIDKVIEPFEHPLDGEDIDWTGKTVESFEHTLDGEDIDWTTVELPIGPNPIKIYPLLFE
jgi:hypothetical protein